MIQFNILKEKRDRFWNKKFIQKLDWFIWLFLTQIFTSFAWLFFRGRVLLEKYAIYKKYDFQKQFESSLDPEAILFMAMSINSRMSWTQIHEHFFKKTGGRVYLSKRQCYKILETNKYFLDKSRKIPG